MGSLPTDTWGQLFQGHPALLQPLLSWVRRELGRIFRTRHPEALILPYAVGQTLCLFGLEEELLVQLLELDLHQHAATFVCDFLDVAVQLCSREAHRLLGLNVPPVAEHREASPVPEASPPGLEGVAPGPVPAPSLQPASSSGDEVPGTSREAR